MVSRFVPGDEISKKEKYYIFSGDSMGNVEPRREVTGDIQKVLDKKTPARIFRWSLAACFSLGPHPAEAVFLRNICHDSSR